MWVSGKIADNDSKIRVFKFSKDPIVIVRRRVRYALLLSVGNISLRIIVKFLYKFWILNPECFALKSKDSHTP